MLYCYENRDGSGEARDVMNGYYVTELDVTGSRENERYGLGLGFCEDGWDGWVVVGYFSPLFSFFVSFSILFEKSEGGKTRVEN